MTPMSAWHGRGWSEVLAAEEALALAARDGGGGRGATTEESSAVRTVTAREPIAHAVATWRDERREGQDMGQGSVDIVDLAAKAASKAAGRAAAWAAGRAVRRSIEEQAEPRGDEEKRHGVMSAGVSKAKTARGDLIPRAGQGKQRPFLYCPYPDAWCALGPNGRLAWASLCRFAKWDEDASIAECYPNLDTLCDVFDVGKRRMREGLDELESVGAIRCKHEMRGKRVRRTQYILTPAAHVAQTVPKEEDKTYGDA
ncbi:MAG: hypothetical protein IJR14_09390 [Synergistaceae bacterium]|nr:hypothetical protein [Synergistaceae bacterium]